MSWFPRGKHLTSSKIHRMLRGSLEIWNLAKRRSDKVFFVRQVWRNSQVCPLKIAKRQRERERPKKKRILAYPLRELGFGRFLLFIHPFSETQQLKTPENGWGWKTFSFPIRFRPIFKAELLVSGRVWGVKQNKRELRSAGVSGRRFSQASLPKAEPFIQGESFKLPVTDKRTNDNGKFPTHLKMYPVPYWKYLKMRDSPIVNFWGCIILIASLVGMYATKLGYHCKSISWNKSGNMASISKPPPNSNSSSIKIKQRQHLWRPKSTSNNTKTRKFKALKSQMIQTSKPDMFFCSPLETWVFLRSATPTVWAMRSSQSSTILYYPSLGKTTGTPSLRCRLRVVWACLSEDPFSIWLCFWNGQQANTKKWHLKPPNTSFDTSLELPKAQHFKHCTNCGHILWQKNEIPKPTVFDPASLWMSVALSSLVKVNGSFINLEESMRILTQIWLVVEPTPLKNMLVKMGIFPKK